MKDLTLRASSLRSATASGRIRLGEHGVALVDGRAIAKGDVVETVRVVALLAIKQTPLLLPHCHPIPVLDADVETELTADSLVLRATVRTIAATGPEVEAIEAVVQGLVCAYDLCKPHVPDELEITDVRLEQKSGGRGDRTPIDALAHVLVCSDRAAAGTREDTAGPAVVAALADAGFRTGGVRVVPDEPELIRSDVEAAIASGARLVVSVGGTGIGPRDRTVEAIRGLNTSRTTTSILTTPWASVRGNVA